MKDVSKKIKNIRLSLGYSQATIAERLGISPNAYGKIERSEVDINLSRLEQIVEVLGVTMSDIFLNHDNTDVTLLKLALEQKQVVIASLQKEIFLKDEIIILLKNP
jgi:transcriptional regulator with XRE-family HTH domain